MQIIKFIILSLFALLAKSIILALGKAGTKKCLYTQLSTDKVMIVAYRPQKRVLELLAKNPVHINIVNENREHIETIHSLQNECQSSAPARGIEPEIYKHSLSNQDTTGRYEICVQVLQNDNQEIMVEMFIGQRLNPALYESTSSNIPLVASSQLANLNLNIESIAKSLAKTSIMAKGNRERGLQTQKKLKEVEQTQVVSQVGQIVIFILFGFFWIKMAKRLKKN